MHTQTYYDKEVPICTCLDSAYERQALADGYKFYPKFYENKIWLRMKKITPKKDQTDV